MSDFLALDTTIHNLLDAPMTALGVAVKSTDEITGEHDITEYCPAVFIQAGPAPVESGDGIGMSAVFGQVWECVVVVDSMKTPSQRAAEIAGPIIQAVIANISGAKIAGGKFISCTGMDQPVYGPGYAEFPIQFAASVAVVGQVTETF